MIIISGGQTGADRAGLDFAIERGIDYLGWVPKGRRSEDGRVPDIYVLRETPAKIYQQRTLWNVYECDVLLLFTLKPRITGGSLLTWNSAMSKERRCYHIIPEGPFPKLNNVGRFMIAGSRESKEPGIYTFALQTLRLLFPRNQV